MVLPGEPITSKYIPRAFV